MIVEETRPCWTITCDCCGDGDDNEFGGHVHWESEEAARREVETSDWATLADGRLVCEICWDEVIPDEVACPRCGAAVGEPCVYPEADWAGRVVTCDERIEAWAAAHPTEARKGEHDAD